MIYPSPTGGSGDGSRTARVHPLGWERGKVKATTRRLVPLFHVGLSPKGKRYGGPKRGDRGLRWLSRINRPEELPSEILAFAPPSVCNPPCVGATAEGSGTRSSGNDESIIARRGGRSTPYGIMECREKDAPLEHLKQWHELLEPYWRRWSTLGRPSILFCIRALCKCGRQRDRTSCQYMSQSGPARTDDREVAVSKSTGRLAWVACEPDDWLPGLDNALRGAKGSRRGGGIPNSKGFGQLSMWRPCTLFEKDTDDDGPRVIKPKMTRYYGRTQIAMNRFPVLSKSRSSLSHSPSLLMDCCPSVAAGDSLVETNRLALIDASRPR
ncbi:hypothetical protein BO83DRAFT_403071 [Aspergillus eucalypticola CBS 122712]|uniref:Uncharacterized protein n=1 Tax=Aspergillus eucalypticola (strain CBS 122712 / IBT 29274) TaxID=1448314 RepID=A0A317UPH7_ASPEC|nr:uncharacterized protein BO83DRAFT_403071 [Aspergillus eucalypticola CBS 122712]PWY63435.1 hypothetical protein BO83DRAFT_403071 [Aspergillus eucalypticola CBS 122712]